jgi:hypothetical protein
MSRLIPLLLLLALFWGIFTGARKMASGSARARRRLIIRGRVMTAIGFVMVLVLPHYVPETPGSPGTLVMLALIWLLGGGSITVSVASIAGAYTARPPLEGDEG